jgi:hypothetical protein
VEPLQPTATQYEYRVAGCCRVVDGRRLELYPSPNNGFTFCLYLLFGVSRNSYTAVQYTAERKSGAIAAIEITIVCYAFGLKVLRKRRRYGTNCSLLSFTDCETDPTSYPRAVAHPRRERVQSKREAECWHWTPSVEASAPPCSGVVAPCSCAIPCQVLPGARYCPVPCDLPTQSHTDDTLVALLRRLERLPPPLTPHISHVSRKSVGWHL